MWKSGSPDELPDKLTSLKVQYAIMNLKMFKLPEERQFFLEKLSLIGHSED